MSYVNSSSAKHIRTKKFYDAVFHQKSKKYDVLSLLYLWLAKKTRPLHEILTWLVT